MSARLRSGVLAGLLVCALAAAPALAAPPDRLHRPGLAVNRHTTVLPHDLHAASWIVADAGSGAVLAAQDAHHKYLPASTQKVLTALTLLPKLPDRRRIVTAVQADADVDGTRVGLVDRGRYSVGFLFSCMLMMSGNDCAEALARAAGGVRPTLAAMNAKARALGAHDTYAGTPSGLDARGQSSSAFDLAVIMRAALKIPDFVRYNSKRTGVVPAQGKKYPAFAFANDNRLRAKGYAGLLAAKNGYTDAARHTYVCAARRGGRTIIVALMHAERNVVDTDDQAAQLMNWGFAVDGTIRPVGTINVAARPRPHHAAAAAPKPTASARPASHHVAAAGSGGNSNTWLYVLVPIVVVLVGGGLVVARRR